MDCVVITTFVTLIGFLGLLFVNIQAVIGPDSHLSLGWFRSSTFDIYKKYPTPITPAGYTFGIWGLVFLWSFAWIVYVITTLFRSNARGPVYRHPPATSVVFLSCFIVTNLANVLWLFLWDREWLARSLYALLFMSVSSHVSLFVCIKRLHRFTRFFEESELWAYRVLVLNGINLYTVWIASTSMINLAVGLIYDMNVPSDVATYIPMSIMALILVSIFVVDISVADVFTRYVVAFYPTVIWTMAGIMVANGNDTSSFAFIYAAVIGSLASAFLITKIVLMIVREPVFLILKKAQVESSTYHVYTPLK